jgi:hypothetical protein
MNKYGFRAEGTSVALRPPFLTVAISVDLPAICLDIGHLRVRYQIWLALSNDSDALSAIGLIVWLFRGHLRFRIISKPSKKEIIGSACSSLCPSHGALSLLTIF